MKFVYYLCPKCLKHTSEMPLSQEVHNPSEDERRLFPHIAHEVFECPCGWKGSGIDLREVVETVDNEE